MLEDFFDFMGELIEENKVYKFVNSMDNRDKQMLFMGSIGLYFCLFDTVNSMLFECFKIFVALVSGGTGFLISLMRLSTLLNSWGNWGAIKFSRPQRAQGPKRVNRTKVLIKEDITIGVIVESFLIFLTASMNLKLYSQFNFCLTHMP